ncbi:FadR/GntR family transcriptional regulator [Paenarthrobacter sp. NPDC091669]|uniref:FadR/GntR family transcriptional regulator n=1 Tax=Paenarthrobacter sp. NPDC091669 TaxID=3364384 RepID=UPI0037F8186A
MIAEFSPVRSRRVSADVMNQILDRIKSGELREGDVLPGERTLAAQMDVSRPTVSTALTKLVEAGILRTGQGRGGNSEIVSIWIPSWLEERGPDQKDEPGAEAIFRVLEARKAVEPRVAQLAALRATDAHFRSMQNSIDLLRQQRDDLNKAEQAEILFHRIMWRAADNPSLERMMKNLARELSPIHDMMLRTPDDYEAGIELHERTLRALKRGDPKEIEREMIHHLEHFEGIVSDVLQRTPHRRIPEFMLPSLG